MNTLNRSLFLLASACALVFVSGCSSDGPPADPATPNVAKTEQLSAEERIQRTKSSSLPPEIKQQKIDEISQGK